MPALVNFGGDDDIRQYCTPRKRSRFSYPFNRGERKHHQKQEPYSLDSLPDECLYEILKRLPGNQERSNSACVSKRWLLLLSSISASELSLNDKEIAGDSKKSLPARCLEGREVTDVRLAAISVASAGHGGLGKLSLRGSHPTRGVTNLGLSAVARCCPSLKSFSMSKVPCVSDEGLSELANRCAMLEKIDICECPLISDKGLVAIGKCCPKLESVSIKDCPLVGDAGIAGVMSSASSSLTKLKLENLNVGDPALACIGHYGREVTKLQLAGLKNVAERGFWCMGKAKGLQKLRSIAIASCPGVTDIALGAVAKGRPSLKQLCVRKCPGFTGAGLAVVGRVCRGITHLDLGGGCVNLTDSEICALVKGHGDTLRVLNLDGCGGLSDRVMLAISEHCGRLEELDVSRGDVTDYGIALLASARRVKIRVLSVAACLKVTARSLPLLGNMGMGLVGLNLQGCKLMSCNVAALEEKMWWCDVLF